jgi:hypothetical protein
VAAPQRERKNTTSARPKVDRSSSTRRPSEATTRGGYLALSLGLMAVAGVLAFIEDSPNVLQSMIIAGGFATGLASTAWQLLPGQLTVKRKGVVATGGIALFLIILLWLQAKSPTETGFFRTTGDVTTIGAMAAPTEAAPSDQPIGPLGS